MIWISSKALSASWLLRLCGDSSEVFLVWTNTKSVTLATVRLAFSQRRGCTLHSPTACLTSPKNYWSRMDWDSHSRPWSQAGGLWYTPVWASWMLHPSLAKHDLIFVVRRELPSRTNDALEMAVTNFMRSYSFLKRWRSAFKSRGLSWSSSIHAGPHVELILTLRRTTASQMMYIILYFSVDLHTATQRMHRLEPGVQIKI